MAAGVGRDPHQRMVASFRLIAKLYRVPKRRYEENLERFVDLLGMAEFLQTPVRQLSLGQRMRGDLAAAMLYEPRVLYLDEPTIGLDVVAKERIRDFIERLNRDSGTTVILTTHDLADALETGATDPTLTDAASRAGNRETSPT